MPFTLLFTLLTDLRIIRFWNLIALCLSLSLSACITEYQFTRETPQRGTFGEEVYHTLHQDTQWSARDSEARRTLLERDRESLVRSLDLIVTEERLDPLEETLRLTAPLQDTGLIPNLTRKTAQLLSEFSVLESTHQALSTRRDKSHDVAFNVHHSFLEQIVNTPQLEDLVDLLIRITLAHDGWSDVGEIDYSEHGMVTELLSLFTEWLNTLEPRGVKRLEVFLGELLLWSDSNLASNKDPDQISSVPMDPLWVVRLDARGVPKVRLNSLGDVYAPFIDQDGDGLADLDDQGFWLDFFGQSFEAKAFVGSEIGENAQEWSRDGIGRALVDLQEPLFDYVDLNQTIMGFLIDESERLIEQDILFDFIDTFSALLPPKVIEINDQGLNITRYSDQDYILLELAHAMIEVLSFDQLDELFEVSSLMLRDADQHLANLILSFEILSEILDQYPEAVLTENNTLLDDLVEVSAPLMQTEILTDLMIALQDPVVRECSASMIELLSYSAENATPPPEGLYNACFQRCESESELGSISHLNCVRSCPRGEILVNPIHPTLHVYDGTQRSHWERTLALFRTTAGVSYEMKVQNLNVPFAGVDVDVANTLPPLLRIDDVAAAYIQAVAGDLYLADYVTEEAILSEDVHDLLLSGVEQICGSDAFESLVSSLVNVTEEELTLTCERFEQASQRNDLPEETRQRQRIAITITLLSRLTDVSIDERPSAGQLTRFFNTPNPSLDLSIASLSLSQLEDQDGYLLWEHHGDMLYAVEATGLLDCIHPIFKVLSQHHQTATFAQIAAQLDAHYLTPEIRLLTARGVEAPRAGRGTGIIRFERVLRTWLERDSIFENLSDLVMLGEEVISTRGNSLNATIATFISYVMKTGPGFTRRNGTSVHIRADQRSTELSPFWLVIDSLKHLDNQLDLRPEIRAKWQHVVEVLLDRPLEIERYDETVRFKYPAWITLARGSLEVMGRWAHTERDLNQLRVLIREDIYGLMKDVMLGRALPHLIDLYQATTTLPEDRDILKSWLMNMVEVSHRNNMRIAGYHLLAELHDETSFINLAHLIGFLLDPSRTWEGTIDQRPLFSHGATVWREVQELAPNMPLIDMIRASLTRDPLLPASNGDPQGREPLWVLGEILTDYHRVNPSEINKLTPKDYQLITHEIAQWILDDDRGLEQLYELVQLRKK